MKRLAFVALISLVISATPLAAQACGNYVSVGGRCQRYVTFPWYAAGAGWSSQIPVLVPSGSGGPVTLEFGIGSGLNKGLLPGAPVQSMYGGFGDYAYFSTLQTTVSVAGSARLDLISGATCVGSACALSDSLAVGAFWATLSAPDAATLEATTLQLVYLNAPTAGAANTTQVAVPPVFNDLATGKWMTSFSETPVEAKAGNVNSSNMAFSVTNLSNQPQSVTISLFDLYGVLMATKSTPILQPGTVSGAQVKPGDLYADSFSNFFGLGTATVTNAQELTVVGRTGTIDGTIVFQSSAGLPIAPLVIRSAGNSNSMMLVTPLN